MRGSSMKPGNHLRINKKSIVVNLLMCILMIGGAVLVPFLKEGIQEIRPGYLIMASILALCLAVYTCIFETQATDGVLCFLIPLAFVISVAFLLLFDHPLMFPFWTFGGLLFLCGSRLKYGLLMNVFLLFIIGSLQTNLLSEPFIIQVFCLILLGIVLPHANTWKDAVNVLISLAAVLVCIRIIFYFILEKEALNGDIFVIALVYAILVVATMLLAGALRHAEVHQEQNDSFDFLEDLAAGSEEQYADFMMSIEEGFENQENTAVPNPFETLEQTVSYLDEDQDTRLEELSDESSALLSLFAHKCPHAFLHSRRVAIFASEVAERMENVNPLLVKCGGYFHEIGRVYGAKSLENTLAFAEKEEFPTALKSVLREHTVDGDKPTSKEAALILLTDNICSMCEHLRKTQKGRILVVKVIDRALNLRLTKGDLSQSGLTAKDLAMIRNVMAEVIKEDMF